MISTFNAGLGAAVSVGESAAWANSRIPERVGSTSIEALTSTSVRRRFMSDPSLEIPMGGRE